MRHLLIAVLGVYVLYARKYTAEDSMDAATNKMATASPSICCIDTEKT